MPDGSAITWETQVGIDVGDENAVRKQFLNMATRAQTCYASKKFQVVSKLRDMNSQRITLNLLDYTGTSLLAVPRPVINKVQELVSKMHVGCQDLSSLPNLVFEMGGKLFSLPPDAYVAEVEGKVPEHLQSFVRLRSLETSPNSTEGPQCNVLLMESYMDSKQGPVWIFGMPFFRKYYTTFAVGDNHDSRALYIAEANDDCRPSEGASLVRTRPHKRVIDVSKVLLPPLMKKKTNGPVDL